MVARWLRRPAVLAAAALALLCVALLVWVATLRQANARLSSDLRIARRGARPALPPAAASDSGPAALAQENARLRRSLEQATVPQVNVPTVDLLPLGQGEQAAIAADGAAILVLKAVSGPALPAYRLRALAHDGSIVWEGSGLRRGPAGTFTVVWPAELAQPGQYRLELFGPRASDPRVTTFPLLVRAAEAE